MAYVLLKYEKGSSINKLTDHKLHLRGYCAPKQAISIIRTLL